MSKGQMERREFLRVSAVAGLAAASGAVGIRDALARRDRHLWGAYVDQRNGQEAQKAVNAFESMIGRKLDVTRHTRAGTSTSPPRSSTGRPMPATRHTWRSMRGRREAR